jgi:hypothetical protein
MVTVQIVNAPLSREAHEAMIEFWRRRPMHLLRLMTIIANQEAGR